MAQAQEQALQGVQLKSFFDESELFLEWHEASQQVMLRRKGVTDPLAICSREAGALARVEFYDGKGGLTAVITTETGTKYFSIPGSNLSVSGVRLTMPGEPIQVSAVPPAKKRKTVKKQTVTPHAVILGAGLATRFEPISGENTQNAKPSIPLLGDKSVIRLIAENLVRAGFSEIFINTYYKREALKSGLKGIEGVTLRYLDEDEPSGTAGGLRQIFDEPDQYVGYFSPDKPLLVVQGDAITDVDFSTLMQTHLEQNAAVTIGCMVKPDKDVSKFGIVATDQSGKDGQSGQIQMFLEKPTLEEAGPHRLANTGFYIFAPETFHLIRQVYDSKMADVSVEKNSKGEVILDFAMHVFPEVLKQTKSGNILDAETGETKSFWAQVVEGYWSDIGNPSQYIQSVRDLYAGKADIPLPEHSECYYDADGIIYWPGAKDRARAEQAELSGNVVVALPLAFCSS